MSGYSVRPAVAADFDRVFPLLDQLFAGELTKDDGARESFRRSTREEQEYALVAEEGESILGYCSGVLVNDIWYKGNVCQVTILVVEEAARSRGIGAALLARAEELACAKGCTAMELHSRLERTRAHHFYEAHGYQKWGFALGKNFAAEDGETGEGRL